MTDEMIGYLGFILKHFFFFKKRKGTDETMLKTFDCWYTWVMSAQGFIILPPYFHICLKTFVIPLKLRWYIDSITI